MIHAFLIGLVAGSRTMMAPTAVSWAAYAGWLPLDGTPMAFVAHAVTAWTLTAFAMMELVVDQLPTTPSRTVPPAFAARIVTGSFSGAAIGAATASLAAGLTAGLLGAIVGTIGGRAFRGWLAGLFGNDHPAALLEDALVISGAYLIVSSL
jgi:uncharacterized membrane protein